MARELIRGKVAKVLNDRMLAINIGTVEGVRAGMLFDVLSEDAAYDVCDPDTGEVLGSVGRPKIRVKVGRAGRRIAIAHTYAMVEVNVGGRGDILGRQLAGGIGDIFEPPKWVEQPETLESKEKAWDDLPQQDEQVKSGDVVVEVPEGLEDIDAEDSALLLL